MAHTSRFEVIIKGKGGHGSQPHVSDRNSAEAGCVVNPGWLVIWIIFSKV